MPWFNVDDGFHCHPKVLAAGNAAMGLWARLGSYCARYATDGVIPNEIVKQYGTKKERETLIELGWILPVSDGFQMRDYLQYNRTAEQIAADRAKAADRKRRQRERDSHGVTSSVTDGVSHKPQSNPIQSNTSSNATSRRRLDGVSQDDDDLSNVLDLIVDARCHGRTIDNPRAYRAKVLAEAAELDGVMIRSRLDAGLSPEETALDVLGWGAQSQQESSAIPWCNADCSTCSGDAWIDTGAGLAPCPERTTQ